jgi:hypothetical protein
MGLVPVQVLKLGGGDANVTHEFRQPMASGRKFFS